MVRRETVEGIVWTALATQHSNYNEVLTKPEEFVSQIGARYEEQVRADAAVEAGRLAGTLPTVDLAAVPSGEKKE